MMIGERHHRLHTPPLTAFVNNKNHPSSPFTSSCNLQATLHNYNQPSPFTDHFEHINNSNSYCENFMMYEFKIRRCVFGGSHEWTDCPFTHANEKARRRDPRKYHYSGIACPDFRKGFCKNGDACEFSHGVFECWLHPAKYRTQPCKDGMDCKRKICFFAHSPHELRVLSNYNAKCGYGYDCCDLDDYSIDEMVNSVRKLQLGKMKSLPSSWTMNVGSGNGFGFGSVSSMVKPEFYSLPTTPRNHVRDEEFLMERVESGKGLRAKMFEKLSKENLVCPVESDPVDFEWVSDLIQ